MSKTYFTIPKKRRKPPMKDDLTILKVEYLSNPLLDQILMLGVDDQTISYKSLKRRPQANINLKVCRM
jgi:hypothetical protein